VLLPLVERLLQPIDFIGLCEVEFLLDDAGRWRVVELNPRPWLQVGLAHHAGAALAVATLALLRGDGVETLSARDGTSWVNLERLWLAALSGEYGRRLPAARRAIAIWLQADTLAIYSSPLRRLWWRWWSRMASKLVHRLLPPRGQS
jgi:predicted ATP-grasp superfamily ATP-dependent carboligase